jgi:NADH:ubiquinone oxidoreductase subunit F (NADH-binding)/NAD-dependent dihydropyrimidine dehydrogenase PreA subunit/(2Fe-2S) ferredoxin
MPTALEALKRLRTDAAPHVAGPLESPQVLVGIATCALAAGAADTLAALESALASSPLAGTVTLGKVGCIGSCSLEPLVEVRKPGEKPRMYVRVDAARAAEIIRRDVVGGQPIEEALIEAQPDVGKLAQKPPVDLNGAGKYVNRFLKDWQHLDIYSRQLRVCLRNVGRVDPEKIDDYLTVDGYEALAGVLDNMTPEQVIEAVTASGLRGRGGAGFPTGMKWRFARAAEGDTKFVICNADEGDPGAFMDRSTLEGDPHSVLEAMMICGYAIGSSQGYMYVRAEYPLAVKRLRIALDHARERGLLGENILGSGFSFDIEIRLGAGAFVCGEETALIASIEGKRGMPRPRPPYPANKGLWGHPTNINNVETLASIPAILLAGPEWYASIGTEKSKGTKVFALAGNVENTGLVEVPMGVTLREVIYDIGGGIPGGRQFKAAQTGGPSGGCLPTSFLDTPIDYESLQAAGAIMGSGGLIVMDEHTCMVDLAKFFLTFTQDESCGKCTPCREGTKRMLEVLERITGGEGETLDFTRLERLGTTARRAALCGLGQTAPNPVLSTLRHFRDEYETHIHGKQCPAGVCSALVRYVVIAETCIGCGLCKRVCPVHCIAGEPRKPHVIAEDACVRCGACHAKCPVNAIARQ